MSTTRYRKKPVEIEAAFIDYDKQHRIPDEFRAQLCRCDALPNEWPTKAHVHTLKGPLAVRDGDWLIKGVQGEFYPCKPDIFAATYERVALKDSLTADEPTGRTTDRDQMEPNDPHHRPPSIADGTVDPTLVSALRALGDQYGPLGVALAAAELTDTAVLKDSLITEDPRPADSTLRDRYAEKLTNACPHFTDDPECAELTAHALAAVRDTEMDRLRAEAEEGWRAAEHAKAAIEQIQATFEQLWDGHRQICPLATSDHANSHAREHGDDHPASQRDDSWLDRIAKAGPSIYEAKTRPISVGSPGNDGFRYEPAATPPGDGR